MKPTMIIKLSIDGVMTVLLLCLMAFQVTGELVHEWIGAAMMMLFVLHNGLNWKWYRNLFKGAYKTKRMVSTVLNLLTFAVMLMLMYSGIKMSRYVFSFIPKGSGISIARQLHLMGSYWAFILMSLHLGLHWHMVMGVVKRLYTKKTNKFVVYCLRGISLCIAGYGLYCFINADIMSYLFLRSQFVFFDYEQHVVSVFVNNI